MQDRVANIKSELKSLEGNLDLSDRAIDTMQQKIDDLNRKIAKQTNQVTNLSKEEKQSLPIQSRKKDIATKVIQKGAYFITVKSATYTLILCSKCPVYKKE